MERIRNQQANHYADEYNYLKDSPHLRHRHLNATLDGWMTRLGRLRGGGPGLDHPGDLVEYHVVRNGVDEQAIAELLTEQFENVRVERHWSSQGSIQHRLGERAGLSNTFVVLASGFTE